MQDQSFKKRLFAATCYIFGIPSLYIILSNLRKVKSLAFHAAQALSLWFFEILFLIVIRIFVFWLNNSYGLAVLKDYILGPFWFFMLFNVAVGILLMIKVKVRLAVLADLAEKMS
ncbi:MAG: hypothetical protein KKB81_06465 [Candidatus Margulisbacteria bacterium]|nr:hypothetical protein [Candidatus Margulisiibacteriota bacterium]MBU1022440.1 hypothetical protein [Candidatus Margulisiibacteriota bacterium]MBU1728424.1 hypothetical protein [Candidatus Margulisiibacteriota bacterium]MBU1954571.1 hypothetical protein [Candidatus Margulisiibacteriota bacterium]